MKIGLIGLGKIAESVHLRYLSEMEHVQLAAVMDVDGKRAEEIAEKYNAAKHYTDAEKMLAETALDAVIICTPNKTHVSLGKMAAEKGIHVFFEKPIGTDLDEVKEYLDLAERKNVLTMVGMTHRFRRDAAILEEYASLGTFGDIHYAKAKLFRRRGTPVGWFTDRGLAGGGSLMDIGVHVLDLAWWILGKPKAKTVSGQALNTLGNYATRYSSTWESANPNINKERRFDVDDFGSAYIRFENGAVLSLEVAWAVNGEQDGNIELEVFGNKGGGKLEPLTIYKEENNLFLSMNPVFDKADPFKEEVSHFIEAVRKGEKPLSDGEQGYEVLKMLDAIYRSSEKRAEVSVE